MQGWEFYSKNAACGEKSPLTLLKADLKTRLLCQIVEQTVLLFCSFIFLSESTALSKSPPDFQLLSLVAVPDKQNLLDQADFMAAPAHMATSVAHSLSWGDFPPPLHGVSFMFKIHFSPNSYSVLLPPNNTSSLGMIIYQKLCTLKEPVEDRNVLN